MEQGSGRQTSLLLRDDWPRRRAATTLQARPVLLELRVENYAVIDNVAVEFAPGLNLLTGETGAGKSILIDALALLLGEKSSSEMIRHGAEKTVVAGVFEAERRIAAQREYCAGLSSGKIEPALQLAGGVHQSKAAAYKAARRVLDELTVLAAGADAARAANATDHAEIERLAAEIKATVDPLVMDPKRMRWCE